VSGSVQFQPEQISAVTDSVPEQWQPDHTIRQTTAHGYCLLTCVLGSSYIVLNCTLHCTGQT